MANESFHVSEGRMNTKVQGEPSIVPNIDSEEGWKDFVKSFHHKSAPLGFYSNIIQKRSHCRSHLRTSCTISFSFFDGFHVLLDPLSRSKAHDSRGSSTLSIYPRLFVLLGHSVTLTKI